MGCGVVGCCPCARGSILDEYTDLFAEARSRACCLCLWPCPFLFLAGATAYRCAAGAPVVLYPCTSCIPLATSPDDPLEAPGYFNSTCFARVRLLTIPPSLSSFTLPHTSSRAPSAHYRSPRDPSLHACIQSFHRRSAFLASRVCVTRPATPGSCSRAKGRGK